MELAKISLPNIDDCDAENEVMVSNDLAANIKAARTKLSEFNSHILGISAIHPEVDPVKWPGPHGQNVYKPPTNVLRDVFVDFMDNPSKMYEHYTSQINRFMLHKCRFGYCLDHKRVKVVVSKDSYGQKGQK